jgi:Tfp pilus assembly ATPase PilU
MFGVAVYLPLLVQGVRCASAAQSGLVMTELTRGILAGNLCPDFVDASKTVERIIGAFPMGEQRIIRNRLAKSSRTIVSQQIRRNDGTGRVAIVEILKSTLRTREYVEKGEQEGKMFLEAMTDGDAQGMQHLAGEIEKLVRAGVMTSVLDSPMLRIVATCGSR